MVRTKKWVFFFWPWKFRFWPENPFFHMETCFFAQLCPVVARTWLESRSVHFFLAPKIRNSARKSVFSYGNLFFRTATWVAQVVTQILRPTDLVYDFSFPSYARFREGTRPMPQKVFPHPTVRAPSASNSPSALSARALRARALFGFFGFLYFLDFWIFIFFDFWIFWNFQDF